MKLGNILRDIVESKARQYQLRYPDELQDLFSKDFSADQIDGLQISPLLVVASSRQISLLAIAFAIRIASALGASLVALTHGIHSAVIRGETDEHKIPLIAIEEYKSEKELNVQVLRNLIRKHNVGLLIIPPFEQLVDNFVKELNIPILVAKRKINRP